MFRAKLGIGPTIENGFYYDFDLPRTLIPSLQILEKKTITMKQNQKFALKEEPGDKSVEFLKTDKNIRLNGPKNLLHARL